MTMSCLYTNTNQWQQLLDNRKLAVDKFAHAFHKRHKSIKRTQRLVIIPTYILFQKLNTTKGGNVSR